MSSFPDSPRTLKGGFILMDAEGKTVLRTVSFQYNPDSLTRSMVPRAAKIDAGDRLEGLRLVGPPVETYKFDIEYDATDALEFPGSNQEAVKNGVAPQLADLETMITPATGEIAAADALARTGALEIMPLPSPLLLLVLGANRTLPVRVNDYSIVEEAFDSRLNPIRARVSISLRALSIDDLAFGSKGAALYMVGAKRRETLANRQPPSMQALGLKSAP